MGSRTESRAEREQVGRTTPRVTAMPEGRMQGCQPVPGRRRIGPLVFGLGLGAVLWLAIGLFSWQFFR